MMSWRQLGFQDPSSPVMEELVLFHDFTMTIIVFILANVLLALVLILASGAISLNSRENQWLESLWTAAPGVVLIQLAIPSLSLLYLLEEDSEYAITAKAIGHQWFWSYEMGEFNKKISFDSYMAPHVVGQPRLLEVDSRLVLPLGTPIRVLVSSSDVLHAWAVPSLGVKADACPGRINQLQFTSHRPGVFYGQCSEICGANHSFMPIVLEMVSISMFLRWAL